MNEWAGPITGAFVTTDEALAREFEARLHETSTLAFRVAYGVLRHREDAEDVAQEAFAKAYRCYTQLRDRDRFRAWLVRLTWRLALDHRRGDRRRTLREQAAYEIATIPTGEDLALAGERSAHVWNAIDRLSEKLRVVVVLAAIQGHDLQEVARLLELPEGTVKSRLFLARKALAEDLRCLVANSPTR